MKSREAELMQNRFLVGLGPSSNTWPRWAEHFAQRTSVRTRPGRVKTSNIFAPTSVYHTIVQIPKSSLFTCHIIKQWVMSWAHYPGLRADVVSVVAASRSSGGGGGGGGQEGTNANYYHAHTEWSVNSRWAWSSLRQVISDKIWYDKMCMKYRKLCILRWFIVRNHSSRIKIVNSVNLKCSCMGAIYVM